MRRAAVALIDEARCIGCTRCIDACPVDAIVGAQSLMHTVVEAWCIGCALCLPPCPVDCIDMIPSRDAWSVAHRRAAGVRAKARIARKKKGASAVSAKTDRKAIVASILAARKR